MILIPEILFYLAFVLVLNLFLIYPIVVCLLSRNKKEHAVMQSSSPSVSVLVTADNVAELTAEQLQKLEELDYDKTKFELLIGIKDCTSETDQTVLEDAVKNSQAKIFFYENEKSKAEILNELSTKAANEILFFMNADTIFEKSILKSITQKFSDATVGSVCGRSLLIDSEKNTIEYSDKNIFSQYAALINQAEDRCGVVINSDAEVFAMRRELFKPVPTEVPVNINLFLSLSVLEQGYKFTCSDKPDSYKNKTEDAAAGYNQKISEAVFDFYTLSFFKNLIWYKNKFVSYVFWSRKITEMTLPGLLLILFIISFLFAGENLFISKIYFLQLAFYLLALGGYLLSSINVRLAIFSFPFSFVMKNSAILEGFLKFWKERQNVNKLYAEMN